MDEQSLDQFFGKLIKVLFNDLAFYIPSAIIPSQVLDKLKSNIPEHFLNELSILVFDQGVAEFEIEEFNERLLLKRTLLEKNITLLIRKRKEFDEFEFNYILEKYFDQVEFYFFITDWLSTNLNLYNKEQIDIVIIGAFQIQNEFYKSHFSELINLFYASKEFKLREHFNISELLNKYFPDLISRYGLSNEALTIQSNSKIPQQELNETSEVEALDNNEKTIINETISKNKIKKEPLITQKASDDFILESVFNVKLK
jgi:hypothetical protein